jgi:methionyl-tRNA formyltransferase
MKRLVLLINGKLGLEVLRYVISQKETEITGIIVNASNKRSSIYLNLINSVLSDYDQIVPITPYENLPSDYSEVKELLRHSDFGISALFGHVLPQALLEDVDCEIINLHPSLLPIGRGADPIPWSIIDQQKQGITIHIIDSGLDTGKILSQKEFTTDIGMNSGEIYDLATKLLLKELVEIFPSWLERSIEVSDQPNLSGSIHTSKELEKMRVINPDDIGTFAEFLRRLQALTFSDGRKPIFIDESDRLWSINISVTPYGEEDY